MEIATELAAKDITVIHDEADIDQLKRIDQWTAVQTTNKILTTSQQPTKYTPSTTLPPPNPRKWNMANEEYRKIIAWNTPPDGAQSSP